VSSLDTAHSSLYSYFIMVFSRYSELLVESRRCFYARTPGGTAEVTPLQCDQGVSCQKSRVCGLRSGHSDRSAVLKEDWLVKDRGTGERTNKHSTIANTALAQHRAAKMVRLVNLSGSLQSVTCCIISISVHPLLA